MLGLIDRATGLESVRSCGCDLITVRSRSVPDAHTSVDPGVDGHKNTNGLADFCDY